MYAATRVADLFPATVGERVTAERVRAGMTVEQAVGDEWVLDAATLRGIEDGTADQVSLAHLLWLAWTFGCTLSTLTGGGAVREGAVVYHHGPPNMAMAERLVQYLEWDAYFEECGIVRPQTGRA